MIRSGAQKENLARATPVKLQPVNSTQPTTTKQERGNDFFFAEFNRTTGAQMRAKRAQKLPGDEVSNNYMPEAGIRSHQKNIRGPVPEFQTPVVQQVGYGHSSAQKKGLYDMSIYIDPNTIYRPKMNETGYINNDGSGARNGRSPNRNHDDFSNHNQAEKSLSGAKLKESFWAGREPLRPPSPPRFMIPKQIDEQLEPELVHPKKQVNYTELPTGGRSSPWRDDIQRKKAQEKKEREMREAAERLRQEQEEIFFKKRKSWEENMFEGESAIPKYPVISKGSGGKYPNPEEMFTQYREIQKMHQVKMEHRRHANSSLWANQTEPFGNHRSSSNIPEKSMERLRR